MLVTAMGELVCYELHAGVKMTVGFMWYDSDEVFTWLIFVWCNMLCESGSHSLVVLALKSSSLGSTDTNRPDGVRHGATFKKMMHQMHNYKEIKLYINGIEEDSGSDVTMAMG